MVNTLLLVGAVPLGLLDTSTLDLGLPGAGYTHATLDMNWRALLQRLGTPQLPDVVLSSSQHHHSHHQDTDKPDILLAEPPSTTAAGTNGAPSKVKVEVPSSSSSSSPSSQEATKTQGSENRLPLAHWLREALSVLQHKQAQEEGKEVEDSGGAVGREEWREAGALLRKIGDLLDGCTWSGRGRVTSAALGLPLTRPLACCCCLAASVVGLLTWRLLLWCR